MSDPEKVHIKCHWCNKEFTMPKSELEGCRTNVGIEQCFEDPFSVYCGKKRITGCVKIIVEPLDVDICERCALVLAKGSVEDLMRERLISV